MNKSISLIIFFLFSMNFLVGQDITTSTSRINYYEGNISACVKGTIKIDASNSTIFPILITPTETPDNGNSCVGLGTMILDESSPSKTYFVGCNNPVNIPDDCQGEYCFLAERASCSFEFCVTVQYCYHNGKRTFCTKSSGNDKPLPASIEIPASDFASAMFDVAEEREVKLEGDKLIKNKLSILNIFPNPFSDEINLEIESKSISKVTVVIHDILGKEVINSSHDLKIGENEIKVTFPSKIANGIYSLVVYTEDGESHKKLVVNASD